MNDLVIGVLFMVFGVLVGGAGLASAGVGVGIPVIPIGIYFIYRGWRRIEHQKKQIDTPEVIVLEKFEKTRKGKIGIAIILILAGISASAIFIGIPFIFYGLYMLYVELIKNKI